MFNLINYQLDIDKIYLFAKNPYHIKQNINFLINKQESAVLKHLNYSEAFIEKSNEMVDILKDIQE